MKKKMREIIEIVKEYDNLLVITDYDLVIQGCQLTHIWYDEEDGSIRYFAGDMVEDDYAEELFPTKEEFNEIYDLITEEF
jgi:hypothetical protein